MAYLKDMTSWHVQKTCMSMLTYLKNISIMTLIVNHACQAQHIRKMWQHAVKPTTCLVDRGLAYRHGSWIYIKGVPLYKLILHLSWEVHIVRAELKSKHAYIIIVVVALIKIISVWQCNKDACVACPLVSWQASWPPVSCPRVERRDAGPPPLPCKHKTFFLPARNSSGE